MKTRKSINYAFPSSQRAKELGMSSTGCHYVAVSNPALVGGWSPPSPASNAKGFLNPTDPDLIDAYMETQGEPDPYFLRYGNPATLRALRNDYPVTSRQP